MKLPLLQVGLSSATLLALNQLPGGVPKGYLRVLSFNEDSVLVDQRTVQLSAAALNNYETLSTGPLVVQRNGYVSVYVGNESAADVYFDDVTIEHRQGLQVQENQYDPFCLDLAGVSGAAPSLRLKNFYQFNGKENQLDLGLNWNHQDARFYDYQVGRWHTVDPLLENEQESWSPYQFGYDNAVRYSDPSGLQGVIPSNYIETDPMKQLGTMGLQVMQTLARGLDYLTVAAGGGFNHVLSDKPLPSLGPLQGRSTVSEEGKGEYKVGFTAGKYLSTKPNTLSGSPVVAKFDFSFSKVVKNEYSVKGKVAEGRVSHGIKTNLQTGKTTVQVESSVRRNAGPIAIIAAGTAGVDSDGKSEAKATIKAEARTSPKTTVNAYISVGVSK